MTSAGATVSSREILDYWFAPGMSEQWFRANPSLDREIRERFEATWEAAAAGDLDHWADTAGGALALVIVLDQFPLNMYRGDAKSFSTEAKAIAVCNRAIDQDLGRQLPAERLAFLYMPLMHSESLSDQDRSVALFKAAGLEANLRFAQHHRELIRRFGRFPHRNSVLGREGTAEERDYLASKGAFTG